MRERQGGRERGAGKVRREGQNSLSGRLLSVVVDLFASYRIVLQYGKNRSKIHLFAGDEFTASYTCQNLFP